MVGRSPGEQPSPPAGTRPGLSSLKREPRRSAKGPSCGERPCAHTRMRAELVSAGWGRGGPSTQAENARPLRPSFWTLWLVGQTSGEEPIKRARWLVEAAGPQQKDGEMARDDEGTHWTCPGRTRCHSPVLFGTF